MTTRELTDLLAELEKHRLLTPAQLSEIRDPGGEAAPDGRRLAAELIGRGWLTPFQANQLLQGHASRLVLGPYVLLERLGQGGMGQVYKARHAVMDRLVALKVLRADVLENPSALDRFRREIQAAARLTHPNVVLAHDANQVGDTFFLVMEYVEGTDLAKLLGQQGRLPPAEAAECARQAALGLQHAHENGLVHRDVKPSNLIRSAGGVVKVLDLGLARLRAEKETGDGPLTHEGSVMGTPDYMAPEQAEDSRGADIRADVYSLGCTLYHLLAGRPPFPGGSMTQKLLRHQREEPAPVESLCPDVPPGLAAVVRKMMAKRPQDRYQTPAEVAAALAPFAAAGAPAAVPVVADVAAPQTPTVDYAGATRDEDMPRARKTAPPARGVSGRVVLLVGGLLLFFCLVVSVPVVLLSAFFVGTPKRSGGGVTEGPVASVQNVGRPAAGGDGPPARGEGGAPPPERKAPRAVTKVGEPEHLAPRADGAPRLLHTLRRHTGKVRCLAFAPDARRLASGGEDNAAVLWDTADGKQTRFLAHKHPVRALAWSADGKRLASGSWGEGYEADIELWDPATPDDGKTLAWRDRTGTPSRADVRGLAFSPDGKRLASGGGPLRIWDLGKGGEPAVLNWQESFPSYLYGVAFSPDGKQVAAGCHEFRQDNVRVWEPDRPGDPVVLRGSETVSPLSHSDVSAVLAFVAGGTLLVRADSGGTAGLPGRTPGSVWVWERDAEGHFRLRDKYPIPNGTVFALAGAADGRLRVAVAEGPSSVPPGFRTAPEPKPEVKVWDGGDKAPAFDTRHKGAITALAFSPDGRLLATGGDDQTIKVWDLGR